MLSGRSIRRLVWGAALALAALPTEAAALPESPQHLMFEIKFGPYIPHLDSSVTVRDRSEPTDKDPGLPSPTPFSDYFGDPADPKGALPSRKLIGEGEIDYQFFHRFGTLGIGLSAGYTQATASAFSASGSAMSGASYCKVRKQNDGSRFFYRTSAPEKGLKYDDCISGDETKFNLVPIALMLVYRFDVLSKRFRIPLIPYAKVGLGYYIWWIGDSGNFSSQLTTQRMVDGKLETSSTAAAGASLGVVVRPGIAIDLSAIDWRASQAIDQEIGLNRVTAFIEFNGSFVNGFGAANKLDLSDMSFAAGLGFEF